MKIGYDKKGNSLTTGDICKFIIEDKPYEGIIDYSEDYFAYTFEMLVDKFPSVLMSKADFGSIEKIINIWATNVNNSTYEGYRKLIQN